LISVDPAHDFDHQRVAGHIAQLHGIGPAQACGTNRIVRIEFRQLSGLSEKLSVQVGRLFEPDDDISICLPSLLMDVALQVLGESR
jgi:hypothetical protein